MQIRIQIKGDSIMKCQKCGSELRNDAKFCDNCGTAVLLKKQCPKCGKIIDSNAIYCPFCNSSILEKEAPKSKLADVEGLKNDFIKCPKCGNEYKATTPYCPTCGEKTSKPVQNEVPSAEKVSEEHLKNYIEFKKCPNCSEINDSKALFCKKCNYNLSNTPISTKDKKNNLRLIASIGLIVAIVIILILVIVELNKPKDNKAPDIESNSYSSLYEEPTAKREHTQPATEEPTTEKLTEPLTEKEPEPEVKKPAIVNNTSGNGFWAEGNGDYVAQGLNVSGGYAVLHVESYDKGHFSVVTYKNDEYDDLLVNTTDTYSGDVLVEGSGEFELKITAKGAWKITSRSLEIDDTTSFSGTGDAVTGITSNGGGNWKITNSGNGHFSVVEYSLSRGYLSLLANTTGDYNGVDKADKGDDIFFKVKSKGSWTIEKQ